MGRYANCLFSVVGAALVATVVTVRQLLIMRAERRAPRGRPLQMIRWDDMQIAILAVVGAALVATVVLVRQLLIMREEKTGATRAAPTDDSWDDMQLPF